LDLIDINTAASLMKIQCAIHTVDATVLHEQMFTYDFYEVFKALF